MVLVKWPLGAANDLGMIPEKHPLETTVYKANSTHTWANLGGVSDEGDGIGKSNGINLHLGRVYT